MYYSFFTTREYFQSLREYAVCVIESTSKTSSAFRCDSVNEAYKRLNEAHKGSFTPLDAAPAMPCRTASRGAAVQCNAVQCDGAV